MDKLLDKIRQREKSAADNQKALFGRASILQTTLFTLFLDRIVSKLETDENGRIKFNAANTARVAAASVVWRIYRAQSRKLGAWIVKGFLKLFKNNTSFFDDMVGVSETREKKAMRRVFLSWGYDVDKKEILGDGWLDRLTGQDNVKRKVMARLETAVMGRMPLDQFRKDFRSDFMDKKNGLGIVSGYYNRVTFDLYQKFDRSVQLTYKQELGLKWGLYSGTVMKATRPFCRQRVNNIYGEEEIEKWRALRFKGRVEPYDPFLDCGSINCRHHFHWLSEDMKNLLKERGEKVDEYNPLPAGMRV